MEQHEGTESSQAVASEAGPTADATDREADAARAIRRFGYAAAGATLVPIPFSETVAVVPIHVAMVLRLAEVYGVELERESALRLVTKIATAAGMSYIGTRLLIGLTKAFVPVLPGLVGASLVFAGTLALGEVARAHLRGGKELSDEEIRAIYRTSYQAARAEYDPARAGTGGGASGSAGEEPA